MRDWVLNELSELDFNKKNLVSQKLQKPFQSKNLTLFYIQVEIFFIISFCIIFFNLNNLKNLS